MANLSNRNNRNFRSIDARQGQRISKNLKDLAGVAARHVKGSGSKWYALGDVWSSIFLFENKDKAKPAKTRTIHKDHFDKLRIEALHEGKIPVYAVSFGDGEDFMTMQDKDWYDIVGRMVSAESERDLLKEKLGGFKMPSMFPDQADIPADPEKAYALAWGQAVSEIQGILTSLGKE